MNYYPEFAELLNAELTRQDRTASWLAQRLGVNSSTVTRWLNHGTRPGDPETIIRIADLLGMAGQRQALLLAAGYGYQPASYGFDSDEEIRVAQRGSRDLTAMTDEFDMGTQDARPATRIPVAPPLPVPASPLVGREAELDFVEQRLSDPAMRLLTIVGPGGMGKTRLALAAAWQQSEGGRYKHGVFFATLAPLSDATQAPAALAAAVGLAATSGADQSQSTQQQLIDFLRNRKLLLVVDNLEHLPDVSAMLGQILQNAPGVQILATSREMSGLPEEYLLRLGGLDYDSTRNSDGAANSSAGELFLQAIRRVSPDTSPQAGDVGRICRMVEGMPLAIELAASWASVLSVDEIAREIQANLDFLTTTARGVPERHRSVQVVFNATWQRLDDAERQAFARLSVFRGGFTRVAAEQVAGADLRHLRSLTDRSLIVYDADKERFAIHELLRQYGAMRLSEGAEREDDTFNRHCAFYCDLLQLRQEDLKGADEQGVLARLSSEDANLRSAWRWAAEHRYVDRLAQSTPAMAIYHLLRGRYEDGAREFDAAARACEDSNADRTLCACLIWQAIFAQEFGQRELSERLLTRCIGVLKDSGAVAEDWQIERATLARLQGALAFSLDNRSAARHYEESIRQFEEIGEHWHAGRVRLALGDVLHSMGHYSEQRRQVEAALESFRRVENARGAAAALSMLADIDLIQGNWEVGFSGVQQSLDVLSTLHDPAGTVACLRRLSFAHYCLGNLAEARRIQLESAEIAIDIGARRDECLSYYYLWWIEMLTRDYTRAQSYAEQSFAVASELHDPILISISRAALGWVMVHIGDQAAGLPLIQQAATELEEGGRTGDLPLTYALLGLVERELGHLDHAHVHSFRSLRLAVQSGEALSASVALQSIMLLLGDGSRPLRALELYAMMKQQPLSRSGHWIVQDLERHMAALRGDLQRGEVEAAMLTGEGLDFWETAAVLLDELRAMGWDKSG